MNKNQLPKFPKILEDELIAALEQACTDFGTENVDEHLKGRKALSPLQKHIVDHGISGKLALDSIGLLERAIAKLRAYKDGGSVDYISSAIESELAKIRSRHLRRRRGDFGNEYVDTLERNKKIVEIAQMEKYTSSSDKATIISRIENHFGANGQTISQSQIRRVLSKAGLTREKKTKT